MKICRKRPNPRTTRKAGFGRENGCTTSMSKIMACSDCDGLKTWPSRSAARHHCWASKVQGPVTPINDWIRSYGNQHQGSVGGISATPLIVTKGLNVMLKLSRITSLPALARCKRYSAQIRELPENGRSVDCESRTQADNPLTCRRSPFATELPGAVSCRKHSSR